MIAHPRPLIEVFAMIPDFRKPRGKRHPLAAIFALACCAMLCGARSYSAIAEWECNYGAHIARALGFRHTPRCAATLHRIFRRLDCAGFEAQLQVFEQSSHMAHLEEPERYLQVIADFLTHVEAGQAHHKGNGG